MVDERHRAQKGWHRGGTCPSVASPTTESGLPPFALHGQPKSYSDKKRVKQSRTLYNRQINHHETPLVINGLVNSAAVVQDGREFQPSIGGMLRRHSLSSSSC